MLNYSFIERNGLTESEFLKSHCYLSNTVSEQSELHPIADVREGQGCELIHNLVGLEVDGATLEGLYLQIFEYEVVSHMLLVDRIFDGEGKAHIHVLLFAERIGSVFRDGRAHYE